MKDSGPGSRIPSGYVFCCRQSKPLKKRHLDLDGYYLWLLPEQTARFRPPPVLTSELTEWNVRGSPMPLLMLLYVVYGLVLLATPVLTISLYLRQAKLRKQLNELTEENARQLTKLQRAVGELQTKVAAGGPPAAAAPEKPASTDVRQTAPASPPLYPQVRVSPSVVVPSHVDVPPTGRPQPRLRSQPLRKSPSPCWNQSHRFL